MASSKNNLSAYCTINCNNVKESQNLSHTVTLDLDAGIIMVYKLRYSPGVQIYSLTVAQRS